MKEELYPFLMPDDVQAVPAFFAELIGVSYCDGSYRISRKNSPLYVLEYIVEGTGVVISGEKRCTASAGDVYLIGPGDHLYYSDREHPWVKIFMNMRGPLIPALLGAYGLQGRVLFPGCPLEPLFREVIGLARRPLSQKRLMELCALKLHEILMGMARSLQKEEGFSNEALLLKRRIDESASERISIRRLADGIYRSPDYVIKLFKRQFGETPYAYATRRRVLTAQKLLSESRMPVGEIAAALGYPDQQYFSNVFRRYNGCSPTDYRRRNAGAGREP